MNIALESAQGCTPPLIHRDVKTNNILLNANLEAKIADFGLSRATNYESTSGICTAVVGTPGYLDPQYYITFQSSKKSDVYSFGVVLLEVVTGKAPIFPGPVHIIDWVQQRLAGGDIENVLDARMGEYNLNSVWKATDLAMSCTAREPSQRPTMSDVVVQLKECLILELGSAGIMSHNMYSGSDHSSNQSSAFKVEHGSDASVSAGPTLR